MISSELREKLQKRLRITGENEDTLNKENELRKYSEPLPPLLAQVPSLVKQYSVQSTPQSTPRLSWERQPSLGNSEPLPPLLAQVPSLVKQYSAQSTPQSTPRLSWERQPSPESSLRPFGLPAPAALEEERTAIDDVIENIQEKISRAVLERDEANARYRRIKSTEVDCKVELSVEVAKMRIDNEALRRELEMARREHLAESCDSNDVSLEAVTTGTDQASLQDKVSLLEQDVASYILERVRLEDLLRQSTIREAHLQQHLDALQRAPGGRPAIGEVFDIQDNEDSAANCDFDDLEFAYEEGLDLSKLMPMQQALQLARPEADHCGSRSAGTQAMALGAGEVGAGIETASTAASSTMPSAGEEAAYDEHLRVLGNVLARLRSRESFADGMGAESSESDSPSPGSEPRREEQTSSDAGVAGRSPGMQDGREDGFTAPLADLMQVLQQLGPQEADAPVAWENLSAPSTRP